MKKRSFIFLLTFLLGSCFSYTQHFYIIPYGTFWEQHVGFDENVRSSTHLGEGANVLPTSISFYLYRVVEGNYKEECKENVFQANKNIVSLYISALYDTPKKKYTLDNSKLFIIKNGIRYNLLPVDEQNNPVEKRLFNVRMRENSKHYFRLPFVCRDLDDVIFEFRGIYQDDVEYPPIRFKIKLYDKEKNF